MQAEILSANPQSRIRILGVNGIALESGNDAMCQGRVLPWLQDDVPNDVWTAWGVAFRDVVVVDEQNRRLFAYNLTDYDLAVAENYAELKALLLDAAGE